MSKMYWKRFYECANKYSLTNIIRVTSDCPLIDPEIVAAGLAEYHKMNSESAYYSNTIKRTYPRGMDYEVFSFKLLEDAYLNAANPSDKEHVTPYIWKNLSGKVAIKQDENKTGDAHEYRVTLDTAEDRELITKLIEEYDAADLNCGGIITVLKAHPKLTEINNMIEQKKV